MKHYHVYAMRHDTAFDPFCFFEEQDEARAYARALVDDDPEILAAKVIHETLNRHGIQRRTLWLYLPPENLEPLFIASILHYHTLPPSTDEELTRHFATLLAQELLELTKSSLNVSQPFTQGEDQ